VGTDPRLTWVVVQTGRGWLEEEGDDPPKDLTVAEVAGKLEAYWLGNEYRITRSALAALRLRGRDRPTPAEPICSPSAADADLAAWRKVRAAKE